MSPNSKNLHFYKLNYPMPKRGVSIAYNKNRYFPKASERFIDYTIKF